MRPSIKLFILLGLSVTLFSQKNPFQYRFRSLDAGPVQTFENKCARCHGPHGSFYGEGFGSREHGDLRDVVEEMMRGPAFLQPSEAEIQAMTAYIMR